MNELVVGLFISAGFFAVFVLLEAFKAYTNWKDDQ